MFLTSVRNNLLTAIRIQIRKFIISIAACFVLFLSGRKLQLNPIIFLCDLIIFYVKCNKCEEIQLKNANLHFFRDFRIRFKGEMIKLLTRT